MQMEIEKIIEQLIITEDLSELLKQLIEEDTIELKKILTYVFDHIEQMKNETKIECLTQVIAQTSFKTKCLNDINDQVNSIDNNQSKKMFVKKIFTEIGCLIEKSGPDDFDISFMRNYARLINKIMSWW